MVLLKLLDFVVEFLLAGIGTYQILVLKFPCMVQIVKVLMFPKYRKLIKFLHTNLIVCPLEIPIQNVLFPPRPLLRLPCLLLVAQQKVLDFNLELPE